MLTGAMTEFDRDLRWTGWEAEVAAACLDEGIHVFPPPCTMQGKDLNKVSRKAIGLKELVSYYSGLQ